MKGLISTHTCSLQNLLSALLFATTVACGGMDSGNQQIDREAIKEEMEQREVRRILPAEIVEAAYERGALLSDQALDLCVETYQPSKQEARALVSPKALIAIDSLAQSENVSIRWVDKTSDLSQLVEKERQLWEAYLYNVENNLPLNDNVQKLGDEAFVYTKPLVLDSALMQELPGNESLEEPSFLGMWSIQMSKKTLIQSI